MPPRGMPRPLPAKARPIDSSEKAQIVWVRLDPQETMQFSAVVRREGKLYVSWCPELDVASQGKTIETALANLKEAVELYLEDEDARPVGGPPLITTFEVAYGKTARAIRA